MTQIQASVIVNDKVDNKIEQKIKAIGNASITTAQQLSTLKKSINNISSRNITSFSTAVNSLSRTNLNSLRSQMQGLATTSNQLSNSFSSTALQAIKLQIAQTKLQIAQAKVIEQNNRTAQSAINLSNAQSKQAITTANLANAEKRAETATIRNNNAKIQGQIVSARYEVTQARLAQQLERTGQSAKSASVGLQTFIGIMATATGLISGVVGLAQMGDQYQMFINKLMLVSDSAETARNRLHTLTDVALNSYTGVDSVAQLYTRLDMALKQTGGSATEAIQITQTLSKTIALAGLTTAEANSALLQVSQAFNKGKLDGDEFRTVMETMPPLADAIARQFSKLNNGVTVTRGELLKLAPEGKITGEIMKQAVLEMSETVDQKFAQLTPTVGMHLQNLQTEAQMYFGAMFKDTGLAESFGNVLGFIANNLQGITQLAFAFGTAVTVAFAVKGLMAFRSMLTVINVELTKGVGLSQKLSLALRATPFGLLTTGLTAVLSVADTLFGLGIGKSLFPNFDQDKARMNDYINRLADINAQMELMSYTKLTQEQALLNQAMSQTTDKIRETENSVKSIEKRIAQKTQALEIATAQAKHYADQSRDITDMMGDWGANVNTLSDTLERKATIEREIVDLNAELANETRNLEQAQADSIELSKSELRLYEEKLERIENAKKAIEGKEKADINASKELQAQANIVANSADEYINLKNKVDELRKSLQSLLGLNADLAPTISKVGNQSVDEVTEKMASLIEKETAWRKKYAGASKDEQIEMDTEKQLSSQLENFRNDDGTLNKRGEQLLKDRIEADKLVKLRHEQDKKQADAERKSSNGARKKQQEIQRIREEYERYIAKLDDEAMLLQQGYTNYSKYNQLYDLRQKMQQKGLDLSNDQLEVIKAKIDANEKAKQLAKEINDIEENSLQKQREQLSLKLKAIEKANVSSADKRIATDEMLSGMGATASLNQGITGITEQYRLHYQMIDQMRISDQEKETARNTLLRQQNTDLFNQYITNMQQMGGMWEVTANTILAFEQGATQAISSVILGTKTISEAMRDLASTILTEVVNSIIKMGVRWAIEQATMMAIGKANNAVAQADAVATGATITSAMTPAATATAVATQGASVGAGMSALMGAFMAIPMLIGLAGKRRNGGTVNAGSLYQVGEGNAPEIYQSRSGRQYMIAGDNGRVFSNKQVMGAKGGNVVNVTQNVTINGNGQLDADTLNKMREQTRTLIYEVLVEENRDAGGMLA